MSSSHYPQLFSPFRLRSVVLPNRVVMPPMSTGLAGPAGEVTAEQIAFYRERAHGGVGLVIVEFTCVDRTSGISEHRQLSLENSDNLDSHARLSGAIQSAGAVPCIQLQHGGAFAKRDLIAGGLPWAPSDFHFGPDRSSPWARAMTIDEIERIIDAFGRTAALGVQAGYEAFELHGAHGYLLSAFLSPLTNRRDDAWGGDEERRLQFPTAVISRVRSVIGDRPLIYRLSADEFMPGGLSIDDTCRLAPALVAAGADALHASTGLGWVALDKVIEPMSTPEGWRLPLARRLREATQCPVIAVGQIRWPETAERALCDGDADLVALGRPLLADPSWANKARSGRRTDIRPCTSCNYCNTVGLSGGGIACAENPRTGHELDAPLDAGTQRGCRAIVIGAGPGGMAAALMLQAAGYVVELYESRAQLGGGLIASAAPPHKEKLLWYLKYLEMRLVDSGVNIHLNRTIDVDELVALQPAITILAVGATPKRAGIVGNDHPGVVNAYELLMGRTHLLPENRDLPIVVYGGGETGTETAEYLAARSYKVLLITRSPASKLARTAEMIYRRVLRDRIAANPNIEVIPNTSILQIRDRLVTLRGSNGCEKSHLVSAVVLAQGRMANDSIARALSARGLAYVRIGDNRRAGRIGDAVHDAYQALRSLCAAASSTAQELRC